MSTMFIRSKRVGAGEEPALSGNEVYCANLRQGMRKCKVRQSLELRPEPCQTSPIHQARESLVLAHLDPAPYLGRDTRTGGEHDGPEKPEGIPP